MNAIIRKKTFMQFSEAIITCENAFKDIIYIEYKQLIRKMYTHAILWISVLAINVATNVYIFKALISNPGEFAMYVINLFCTWSFTASVCTSGGS